MTRLSFRLLALAVPLTLLLSAAARSAPEVAPYPTPGGYKSVKYAQALTEAPAPPAAVSAGYLGVVVGDKKGAPVVDAVAPGSPAELAGLKEGDVIINVGADDARTAAWVRDTLRSKLAGETVSLTVSRGGSPVTVSAKLKPTSQPLKLEDAGFGRFGGGGPVGWVERASRGWKKPTFKLAVIGIEYPDVKHNPKITDKDWEDSLFSLSTYTGKGATGQPVFGSMSDYYKEISYGKLGIDGKFVGWFEVSKKRLEYSTGNGTNGRERASLLSEALELFAKSAGKEEVAKYDGVFFLYAGGSAATSRGGIYWPHKSQTSYGGRSFPYFIVQEGGNNMTDISVFCHEFGHMLGLPDLYAAPERPASEGVGRWCAMSQQVGGGRPQHFSAWCKEYLGWIKPTVIDPAVRQKLILAPIEDDPTQCIKIKARADNSEYFLLEVRKKQGWDEKLPAEGLLIWRVVNGRPILEESHGIEGVGGPSAFPTSVPFPSPSNDSFTPFTTPSSKGQLGGAATPVYVTNITRLPDGRVTFHVGYDYQ